MKTNFYQIFLSLGLILLSVNIFSQPVIADHRAVDRYDDIPDEYITEVKKMLLNIAGESHARGYRYGLQLLAAQDSKYAISLDLDDEPEAPSSNYLRVSGSMLRPGNNWEIAVGEEDAWTSTWAVDNFVNTVAYIDNAGNTNSAMGIGWCYDMLTGDPSVTADPVYECRWYGRSVIYNGSGGTDISFDDPGWGIWGLDNEDSTSIGGPCVTMDMYLRAIETANASSATTTVFYTTGPVDYKAGNSYPDGMEYLYQVDVKHNYIRDHVRNSANDYLFDYADILCWNDSGEERTEIWNGHTYQKMQMEYIGDYDGGTGSGCHISESACLKLGKAMWWMLAHMAGWKDETITTIDENNIEETNDNNYTVYPNPANDYLTIASELTNAVNVQLIDDLGKIVFNKHFKDLPIQIDLKRLNLNESIYFLRIYNGENTSVIKILLY